VDFQFQAGSGGLAIKIELRKISLSKLMNLDGFSISGWQRWAGLQN